MGRVGCRRLQGFLSNEVERCNEEVSNPEAPRIPTTYPCYNNYKVEDVLSYGKVKLLRRQ